MTTDWLHYAVARSMVARGAEMTPRRQLIRDSRRPGR